MKFGDVSPAQTPSLLIQTNLVTMIEVMGIMMKKLMYTNAISHLRKLVKTCVLQVRSESFLGARTLLIAGMHSLFSNAAMNRPWSTDLQTQRYIYKWFSHAASER